MTLRFAVMLYFYDRCYFFYPINDNDKIHTMSRWLLSSVGSNCGINSAFYWKADLLRHGILFMTDPFPLPTKQRPVDSVHMAARVRQSASGSIDSQPRCLVIALRVSDRVRLSVRS